MEEAKKKELGAKMIEIAEKYPDTEMKDWRDKDKLLLMSLINKLFEGSKRVIRLDYDLDDGTWANSEEGKKKIAELREKIFDKEFKLDGNNLLELEPGAFDDIYFPSTAEMVDKENK